MIAADTQGASDGVPVFLDIMEEIEIGKPAKKRVVSGTCSYVPTGGMIPEGADAVVMVEYCELFDQSCTAVYHALASGGNVVQIGEDVEKGETILPREPDWLRHKSGRWRETADVPWRSIVL